MKKIILGLAVVGAVSLFAKYNIEGCQAAACHGKGFTNKALGKSKVVKDMTKADIEKALKGYKDGTYGGTMKATMQGQVKEMTDAEMKEIAEKFGK